MARLAGKEVRHTVVENTVSAVNNAVVANCKLSIDKPVAAADKK